MTDVPRNSGLDADSIAQTEADHFMKCLECRRWLDMRDLGQVFEHIHDGDVELIHDEPSTVH